MQIVAHASPRWRSAPRSKAADEQNLKLSRQRALEVQMAVEEELRAVLGPSARIEFQVTQADEDGSVTITEEARGSRDTLKEAKGNRKANEEQMRRVEVHIERTDRRTQHAGRTKAGTTKVVLSEWWSVDLKSTHSVGWGGAGVLLDMVLRNEDTGREAHVWVPTLGGTPTPGLSSSASVGGDPVWFKTDREVGFADFENTMVEYDVGGIGLVFVGWELATLSFYGLGERAKNLDVGGWNVGAQIKLGGSVTSGPLRFYGGKPPSDVYPVPPSVDWVPYDSRSHTGDLYVAKFGTGKYRLAPQEATNLRAFVIDLGYRFRDE